MVRSRPPAKQTKSAFGRGDRRHNRLGQSFRKPSLPIRGGDKRFVFGVRQDYQFHQNHRHCREHGPSQSPLTSTNQRLSVRLQPVIRQMALHALRQSRVKPRGNRLQALKQRRRRPSDALGLPLLSRIVGSKTASRRRVTMKSQHQVCLGPIRDRRPIFVPHHLLQAVFGQDHLRAHLLQTGPHHQGHVPHDLHLGQLLAPSPPPDLARVAGVDTDHFSLQLGRGQPRNQEDQDCQKPTKHPRKVPDLALGPRSW